MDMFRSSSVSDLHSHSLRNTSGIQTDTLHDYDRLNTDRPFMSPQYRYLPPERHNSFDDSIQDNVNTSENCFFNKVTNQNPYLVHENVLKTIRMEFALEDSYKSHIPRKTEPNRVRKRRNPHECDWKPESVYKIYVECKPDFFEKTDYQDRIPSRSCFGKINMRIPRAWSRKPNKSKKRKLSTSSESESTFAQIRQDHLPYEELPVPQDVNSLHQNLEDVFTFDFMFGQNAFRTRDDLSSSSTPIYTS